MVTNKKIVTLVLITVVGLAFTGCSDNDSSVVAPAAIDTAPPAVPTEIALAYSDGSATVSWAPNTVDTDLAGYVVIRERYGVSETMLDAPTLINSYVDSAPLSGNSQYHVYSVDTTGNQSAVSTTYLTVELQHNDGNSYRQD